MKRADVRHFRLSPELADPYVVLEIFLKIL
jgi:hypothetical protein